MVNCLHQPINGLNPCVQMHTSIIFSCCLFILVACSLDYILNLTISWNFSISEVLNSIIWAQPSYNWESLSCCTKGIEHLDFTYLSSPFAIIPFSGQVRNKNPALSISFPFCPFTCLLGGNPDTVMIQLLIFSAFCPTLIQSHGCLQVCSHYSLTISNLNFILLTSPHTILNLLLTKREAWEPFFPLKVGHHRW